MSNHGEKSETPARPKHNGNTGEYSGNIGKQSRNIEEHSENADKCSQNIVSTVQKYGFMDLQRDINSFFHF